MIFFHHLSSSSSYLMKIKMSRTLLTVNALMAMSKITPIFTRYTLLPSARMLHSLYKCHIKMAELSKCTTSSVSNGYRNYGTENKKKSSSLAEIKAKEVGAPTTFEQVKETTKTASYLGVIIVGVGVTGIMFYAIFRELFSSKSPNSVYTTALNRCCKEPSVLNALGDPIKGFGEETRRGRRRHVSHLFYEKDEITYLRMKFYIQGSRKRGTVHLEMQENESGKFEYRYLFVQLDDYPRDTIILEDNRYDVPTTDKSFDMI